MTDATTTTGGVQTTPQLSNARATALGLIALGITGVALISAHWDHWMVDFTGIYFAGHFFSVGQFAEIYAAPPHVIGFAMPESWKAAAQAFGVGGAQTFPFIYPPWVAAAMVPVSTSLGPQTAMNLLLLANVAMILTSVWLGWRIMAPSRVRFGTAAVIGAGLMLSSVPALAAVMLGQAQILVFFICLLAFDRYRAGQCARAGALLALAAALKITPAAFALIFLFDLNWRAFASFALTGLALLAASVAVAGVELHLIYLDRLSVINQHIYSMFAGWSIETFLHEIWDAARGTAPVRILNGYHFEKPAWIGLLSSAGLVGFTALAWRVTRRLTGPDRLAFQLLSLSLIVPIFSPLGWAHYFLFMLFLAPSLLGVLPRRPAILLLALLFVSLNSPFQALFLNTGLTVYPQILFSVPMFGIVLAVVLWSAHRAQSQPHSTPG